MRLVLQAGVILAIVASVAACGTRNTENATASPDVESKPDMRQQLVNAEGACQAVGWKTAAGLMYCYDSVDRPIWRREASQTLDLFEAFAARRMAIAEALDRKTISPEQAGQGWYEALVTFQSALAERRVAAELATVPATEQFVSGAAELSKRAVSTSEAPSNPVQSNPQKAVESDVRTAETARTD